MASLDVLRDDEVDGPRPVAFFDLDGTLVNGTTLRHITRRCGVYQEAKEIWSRQGGPSAIDGEGLARIAGLLEGVPFARVQKAARQMFLRPESGEVVNALKDRGFAIGVVADGFRVSAENAAERLKLRGAAGARLEVDDGVITGALTPSPTGECGRWLCREAALVRMGSVYDADVTVAVGDGSADRCMLEAADLAIASDRASEVAIEVADVQTGLRGVPGAVDAFLEAEGIELDVSPVPRRRYHRDR